MNIGICDDMKNCCEDVEKHLKFYFNDNKIPYNIYSFTSAQEIIDSNIAFDIVFLDVEMPQMSGLELGKQLRLKNERLIIFIVTAYDRYLDDAFDLNAFRFLSKPIDALRLYSALDSALELLDNRYVTFLDKNTDGYIKVFMRDIVYIEIVGRKTMVVTEKQEYCSKEKYSYWKEKLCASYFAFPHSSYIVNMNYISRYDRVTAVLSFNNKEVLIPVASKKQSEFKKMFFKFVSRGC